MSLFAPKTIKREVIPQQFFNYVRNGINLSFTLRVDTEKALEDFAELLKVALIDVEAKIDEIKNYE